MAQADQTIQNATFPTVRADINNNLAALFSANSGNTAPSTTVAFQDWIDTSGANPLWKKRNAANNAWITLGTISGSAIAFQGTLPSQTSQSGKYLTTNGTVASWGVIAQSNVQSFLTSTTWTKPSSGTFALVRVWGGGGSGGRQNEAGGGGGGACNEGLYKLADLPASCTVTIGAGGAGRSTDGDGSTGGTSSFSGTGITTLSAFGGTGGQALSIEGSGGGGGGNITAGFGAIAGAGMGSMFAGGKGGVKAIGGAVDGPDNSTFGGAGGGHGDGTGQAGGAAYVGGGGGGGVGSGGTVGAGGLSLFGGNGSAGGNNTTDSNPGSVPGGGSGGSDGTVGAGGAGKVEVFVW